MATKPLLGAIAILVGSIVGAGVLGLPYVFAQAGYFISLITTIIVGSAILMEFLLAGEISYETPGKHQLVGLAKRYLGIKGKVLMQLMVLLTVWGAMLAYTVGSGDVIANFFSFKTLFGLPSRIVFSLVFFFLLSIPIYFGLKTTEKVELPLVIFFISLIIAMCVFAIDKINFANFQTFNVSKAFLPYGVILFAIAGSIIIPEVKQAVGNNAKLLKRAILIGGTIPILLYLFFATIVVGVVGEKASEVATIAFGEMTSPVVVILGNLFALIAMATSFMALGLVLKDTFIQDFKLSNWQAFLLTISIPLVLLFFFQSFASIIGVTGAFAVGLTGILVAVMAIKARKYKVKSKELAIKQTLAPFFVIAVFTLGIILTALQMLGLNPF